jgi:hypothetical protein
MRTPQKLAEISGTERARWQGAGPILAADGVTLQDGAPYVIWPDWTTWAEFYGAVRDELYGDRPWRRDTSVAERLWIAYLAGEDLDVVRERCPRADDPRRRVFGGN